MRRTEVLQGVRQMRFEEIHDSVRGGRLSAAEAAELLGCSERTFRRLRGRYEDEGPAGLLDRRLGKIEPASDCGRRGRAGGGALPRALPVREAEERRDRRHARRGECTRAGTSRRSRPMPACTFFRSPIPAS